MITTTVKISNSGAGMKEALALTEKIGQENGLDRKAVLHLRLLSEELFGMLRSITGEVESDYWLENDGNKYELHLKTEANLTEEMKKQLYSASTSGKNDAAKGFMGKIKLMLVNAFTSAKENLPYAVMNTANSYAPSAAANAATWSLSGYKEELKKNDGEKSEAWDELEKSIVASIANDVRVRVIGKTAEIIIDKAF